MKNYTKVTGGKYPDYWVTLGGIFYKSAYPRDLTLKKLYINYIKKL